MTVIYNQLYQNKENNITSVVLASDLSSAYETIDISILMDKIEHYGIRGGWLELFRSYYTDRKQFVRIDNANSIVRNSPECSVLQGSGISGTMFNIYCNEIPRLHKLINTEIYFKLVNSIKMDIKGISHLVVNFVDDSNNIIGFKEHNKIKIYLENYYNLLIRYYNINKLKINNDKNKLLIISPVNLYNVLKNFSFQAGKYVVKCKSKVKILGTYIQNDLKMDGEINNLASSLHNRINNVNKMKEFTDFKTRLIFMNSFVIGKLIYRLPLYNNVPQYLTNKLHKILMTAARCAIGDYCFKKSNKYILNKCKWLSVKNMITYSSLIFIDNIVRCNKPKSIMQIYRKNRFERHKATLSLNKNPRTKRYSKFFIYEHTGTFNNIPMEIKIKSRNIFKREIKYILDPKSAKGHSRLEESYDSPIVTKLHDSYV